MSLYLNLPFDERDCIFDEGGVPIRKVEVVAFAKPIAMFSPGTTFPGVLPFGTFG